MADGRNYWQRSRLSRRSVLRGAAVGSAGVAGAVLIGCSGGDDDPTETPGRWRWRWWRWRRDQHTGEWRRRGDGDARQ